MGSDEQSWNKGVILYKMIPARGPQTSFFSNYGSGIPELANYEMPNEVCEGNFWGTFFRHRDSRSARTRYLGRQPAILESRLLAAGLRYLRLRYLG